ncbi:MAG: ATPase [Deltaproteobacteria bacterium]|nr:MAG: ATPase [Deltaproteobacteria bacterium]
MKPAQIHAALRTLTRIGQPVFIWGPPGVGKSQVVQQLAAEVDLPLIDIRAILLDPVDLRGLPRIDADGRAAWCAPDFLPRDGSGILFLDELNAAPPLVQAACYQLILDRRIGDYRLPDGWSIVAAGNRETDRAVTHRMPSALANRFTHLEFEIDIDAWLSWADGAGVARELVAFLRFRPGLLHVFDPDKNDKAFPTPRSWEFVSRILQGCGDVIPDFELLAGTVGEGAAMELKGFLMTCRDLPDPETVLAAPEGALVPEDPASLYAICEAVGGRASSDTMPNLVTYARRLPPEFSVMLVREAVKADQAVVETSAFTDWAMDHSHVLL